MNVPEFISAEVEAVSGLEEQAASMLMRLGIEILHIGTTISVRAPKDLWKKILSIEFKTVESRRSDVTGDRVTKFYRPVKPEVLVPLNLQRFVRAISFPEPPELLERNR